MGNLFAELKRRHIYRVAAAYAVVAWVLIQLVNNIAPMLKLPDWVGTVVLVLLAVGFPIAILFAWIQKLASDEGAAARPATGKLDWTLIGALVVVIALVSYGQFTATTDTRTAQQSSAASGSIQTSGISIAVLPFANVSGDSSQEFFSDGMTDEIIAALTKVSALRVVGRESAFQFKGQKPDMHAVSQALGAAYLIEGSVRKAGDRVRITAQLSRADSGVNLWADTYDRDLKDIFATQSDIAQAIARALRVPLGLQQGESLASDRTDDLETYQQYLRAQALFRTRAIAEAIKALEEIVTRDPNYAPAWSALARAYNLVPVYEHSADLQRGSVAEARGVMQSAHDNVERAARKAIQLDSRQARAYSALATVQYERGNWLESEDLLRQALALDPGDPDVLYTYSQLLLYSGRLKESLSMKERLQSLEPFVPIYRLSLAFLQLLDGQTAASLAVLQSIPPDGPTGMQRNLELAILHAETGHFTEAADTVLLISGDSFTRKSVEDAARLLRAAPKKATEPLPDLEGLLNFVYAYVGVPDRVVIAAERLRQIGYITMIQMWTGGSAAVRKTESFKALTRNNGLVDFWRARGWPDLCRPAGADDFVCD